eukprot:CAMPEP_0114679006 /NCGR_PEP_ID=MMETSP0191-20121206/52440_1 /TAXON_ID=126664 /ORGANISM="Sorites sp." /LENGTH=888 /DNA_ID=CAMNT_0001953845 /DNA_START=660 /DNA_END=3323 /DNA_ORIENTATION=-
MKYTITDTNDNPKTDTNDNPKTVDTITITDKNGNIVKQVSNTYEIIVDRTPTNGRLITNEAYLVNITFISPQESAFKIDRECYTLNPTLQPTELPTKQPTNAPTKTPTVTPDIECGESLIEGMKGPGSISSFTIQNGGDFIGMRLEVTDNGNPFNVMSIIITDTVTGTQIPAMNTDSITITNDNDNLVNGRLYNVVVTYMMPGLNIEISRNCITAAPTKKPTQTPVVSTKTPTLRPTNINDPECNDDLIVRASPSHPRFDYMFVFTMDEDTTSMKYMITDLFDDAADVMKLRVNDENGFIVKETFDTNEIFLDRTSQNGGIITNAPYILTVIFTQDPDVTPPRTEVFIVVRECFTATPTKLPTLSPTILQDIACGDSSNEGSKNNGDTSIFTFTNGGEFVGMQFEITDNGNPLTVASAILMNTETGETLKSLTNVDTITVTTTDDNLINGVTYQVTVTYDNPGTNIDIARSCFTAAPTTKPTKAPTTSPIKAPTRAPVTSNPTLAPTTHQDICCDCEVPIDPPEPVYNVSLTFINIYPCPGMEFDVLDSNGNPIVADVIEIIDPITDEIVTVVRAVSSLTITIEDGINFGVLYTITFTFDEPILHAKVERYCETQSPTKIPTTPPTILQGIVCNDESIIEDYLGLTTTEQLFTPGNGMKNIDIYINDGDNNAKIVDSIKITDINDVLIKEELNTNAIRFSETDANYDAIMQYKLLIDYPDGLQKVIIQTTCETHAPTQKPSISTTFAEETTSTRKPTESPTITSELNCNDDLTVPASPTNAVDLFSFDFVDDEDSIGMKYTITDDNGNPLTAEKITITDKDGNIAKEVTDASEIDIDNTPENGGLQSDEPYKVTIIFTSNPSVIPAIMIPFTIDRDCYTNAPTELPTL